MVETMITPTMTLAQRNWKRICLGAGLTTVVLGGAGCSGIHASKGVSPLDFILPGHSFLHGQIKIQTSEPMELPLPTKPTTTLARAD